MDMEPQPLQNRRHLPTRGAGVGLTVVVCLAILAAAVIAGRVILVEFFPGSVPLLVGLGS
jgi:hypothetical protein